VFVETKSGRVAIKAKVVIDATGEADVCTRAGAPVVLHTSPNLGLFYVLGGIDWAKYEKENGQQKVKEFPLPRTVGECKIQLSIGKLGGEGLGGGRTGTSGTAQMVTLMEREHRRMVFEYAQFLRQNVPGFENSYPMIVGEYLMARGGRYLDGVRRVTGEDLEAERKFDDVIYVYHDDRKRKQLEIPYGALLPQKIDGLLACGRAAMVYGPNFRMRYSMMLNGQAAGVAAALSARDKVEPRNLDVKKLQKALLELRCPIGTDERLKELGLK
jgi:hypothetical protein